MSGKISTLILKVDLECCHCYKKIRKVLCNLQEKVHITSISYDEKNGTVTVAGVFDPDRLSKKLRCRAGNVIEKIEEKKEEEKKENEEKKAAPEPGIKFEPVVVTPYFWPPGAAICYPPAAPAYYPTPYKSCQFVCEEESSPVCSIM
ncbi:uncharacterized protein LOC141826008 [Curcuma longa]|uniref:uncharacterized protein LOC141826008 n=1 Tax=Curcuma longa TaxID=136217 RepID=UPI003D9F32C6